MKKTFTTQEVLEVFASKLPHSKERVAALTLKKTDIGAFYCASICEELEILTGVQVLWDEKFPMEHLKTTTTLLELSEVFSGERHEDTIIDFEKICDWEKFENFVELVFGKIYNGAFLDECPQEMPKNIKDIKPAYMSWQDLLLFFEDELSLAYKGFQIGSPESWQGSTIKGFKEALLTRYKAWRA